MAARSLAAIQLEGRDCCRIGESWGLNGGSWCNKEKKGKKKKGKKKEKNWKKRQRWRIRK
jgi:hypothetical protein